MSSLYDNSYSTPRGHFLTRGNQSCIYLTQTLTKVIGSDKDLTHDEASYLAAQLHDYHTMLSRRGWLLPELYSIRLNSGHESELIVQEQYIAGPSLKSLIADKDIMCAIRYLLPIIRLLCAEPTVKVTNYGKTFHRMCYGVDLKPDNLVLSSTADELFLVDTFAPKIMRKSGSWSCYYRKLERLSPRKLQIVTATRVGILLRLIRLMGLQKTSPEYTAVLSALHNAGVNKEELHFIAGEVNADYPLLDYIYA